MTRKIVISPSGNFYGSEQVLFDYLQRTHLDLDIAVPRGSLFHEKLSESKSNHRIRPYNRRRLGVFYGKIFWYLLTGKYDRIYLNEAGHIKYLILMARIFRKKKFIVHVRMIEDVDPSRWKGGITSNIVVLAISKYISERLPVKNLLLYDFYSFSDIPAIDNNRPEVLRIAIIGRITKTKGIGLLPDLLDRIQKDGSAGKYSFELYGEIANDLCRDELLERLQKSTSIGLKGLEKNKQSIYNSVHCVLHLSKQEALGRIYFEAIDYLKPLIGFKAAGIGEIGDLLGLSHRLADPESIDPAMEIYLLLKNMRENYEDWAEEMKEKKKLAIQIFRPAVYQETIDKLMIA